MLTIVDLLGSLWRDNKSVKLWKIPNHVKLLARSIYDYVQQARMQDFQKGVQIFSFLATPP